MIALNGESVCGGVSFGKILVLLKKETKTAAYRVNDPNEETERFEAARKQAMRELDELYERAKEELGYKNAVIFLIHQVMLDDPDYIDPIARMIHTQRINAETAVESVCAEFVGAFEAMEDSYMRERSADVRDISERILRILRGEEMNLPETQEPVIILADELAPSETVRFSRDKILAFVTEKGSFNSHSSILARTMNIPSLIGAKNILNSSYNQKNAIVDGFDGTVYIDPDDDTICMMKKKKTELEGKTEFEPAIW